MPVRGENSLFFSNYFDNSGLQSGKVDAISIVASLGSSISKINPFAALAVGAIAAFATIAKEAFDFAKKYEQAMLEVQTISAATSNDFKGIGNDIFKLSTETLDDPVELAKAYYQIVSAGYDGAKGLRVLAASSKAATAGVTSTKIAADGITTIMNAFGESVENVDNITDAMFKTVELGKTTFDEIASSISNVAPLAASMGVHYNEILAAVASLTKQGVPTAQAMTQIRAALIGVNDVLGDNWAEAYTLQEAFVALNEKGGGSMKELKESVGRIEGVGAILATTGDNAEGAAEDLEKISNASGAAEKAFRTMSSGQINSLEILRNRIRAVTESLGGGLLDAANSVAEALLKMTKGASFEEGLYRKEIVAVRELTDELKRGGVAQERKIEIIDILKEKYPSFLQNIKNEGIFTSEIETALIGVNSQLIKRLKLAANADKILEADKKSAETTLEFKNQEKVLQKEINALARGNATIRRTIEKNAERSFTDQVEAIKSLDSEQSRLVEYQYGILRGLGKEKLAAQRELNKLLGEEKNQREGIVSFDIKKDDKIDPNLNENLNDSLKEYEEFLKERAKMYSDYNDAVTVLGDEQADEIYKDLLSQNETYGDFLKQQLEITESFEKKKAIARAASDFGLDSVSGRAKLETLEIEIKPIVSFDDIDIDNESINAITRKITRLEDKRRKARTDKDRKALKEEIDYLQKKLDAIEGNTSDEIELYESVTQTLESLTGKQLNDYIDYWKKKLAVLKAGTAEEEEAAGKIAAAQLEKISRITDVVTENLSVIGQAFRDFGDEGTADLIDGLVAVGKNLDGVFESFSGNQTSGEAYTQIASSVAGLVSLVVSAAAERKKAEEAYYLSVISFQKEYNQLLNEQLLTQEAVNENVFTTDFVQKIQNGISALEDANSAYQESLAALQDGQVKDGQRNAVSGGNVLAGLGSGAALGAAVGSVVPVIGTAIGAVVGGIVGGLVGLFSKKKKDLFVGLLDEFPELLERSEDGLLKVNEQLAQALLNNDQINDKTKILLQDTLDWAERIKEAREEIKGVVSELAGGLGNSLRDALVSAFESGTDSAKAMGDEVSTVLEGILEQLIFDSIFSEQFKNLQEEMAKSFDIGGDQSWVDDFARFFEEGKILTEDFNKALADAQESGNDFGFDLFKGDQDENNSLKGAISTITEDTAGILAGAINSIRTDVSNGLAVARENNRYLGEISINTFDIKEEIEESNIRLLNIENKL